MTARCWFHVRDLADPLVRRSFRFAATDFDQPGEPTHAEARRAAVAFAATLVRPQMVRVRIEAETLPRAEFAR